MATLRRSKSGSFTERKGIPMDVRTEYQRLWVAEIETRIAAIRAVQKGEGQLLPKRDAHALAGEWYQWYVARHEENPGTPEHWKAMWMC